MSDLCARVVCTGSLTLDTVGNASSGANNVLHSIFAALPAAKVMQDEGMVVTAFTFGFQYVENYILCLIKRCSCTANRLFYLNGFGNLNA